MSSESLSREPDQNNAPKRKKRFGAEFITGYQKYAVFLVQSDKNNLLVIL